MSDDSSEEKTLKASSQKLRKQRQKGNVVTSRDTMQSVMLGMIVLYLFLMRGVIGEKMTVLFTMDPVVTEGFSHAIQSRVAVLVEIAIQILLPIFGLTILVGLLVGMLITGGPVFSVEPVIPKFEKLSPGAGFKRIFGRRALMTFLMQVLRISMMSAILGFVLFSGWSAMMMGPICGFGCAVDTLEQALVPLVIALILLTIVWALIDYAVQRAQFMREQRMSISEFRREIKDMEGDPRMNSELRRVGREMQNTITGLNQAVVLISAAPDVVIGVRYVEEETPAPVLVAKVTGEAGCKRVLSGATVLTVDDDVLAAQLAKIRLGGYITEEDLIIRLAPHLQKARQNNRT